MDRSPEQRHPDRPLPGHQARSWAAFLPYFRKHSGWLAAGTLAACFVVGLRLVVPWPLRALMKPWLHERTVRDTGLLAIVPAGVDPTLAMGAVFLCLILLLGLADLLERLYFARFAIGSVRDIRAEAFKRANLMDPQDRGFGSGDLVARLIGDTARIKAGLKGFLVHVASNGLMFAGVTSVLLWLDLTLGSIFLVAGALVAVATCWGASSMFRRARKFRAKEGRLADFIQETWREESSATAFGDVNFSSGRHEASLTRIQGATTWCAHIVLGLCIVAALWIGTRAVSSGRIQAGDLFVVMMYALMIRAPIVQLSRQGARTGKILACADRLKGMLGDVAAGTPVEARPLRREIHIERALVAARRSGARVRRLGPIDLRIPAGQRVAVLGKPGSGKTTLLELILGTHPMRRGRICWDGQDLAEDGVAGRRQRIAYMPPDPTWPRKSVKDLLHVVGDALDQDTQRLLRAYGANSLISRMPNGVETKLSSADVSRTERTALALVSVVRSNRSVWLLDDPVGGLDKRKARNLIKRVTGAESGVTLVITLSRPVRLGRFDRVLELKRGRIAFDGTPDEWRMAAKAARAKKPKDVSTTLSYESDRGEA